MTNEQTQTLPTGIKITAVLMIIFGLQTFAIITGTSIVFFAIYIGLKLKSFKQ